MPVLVCEAQASWKSSLGDFCINVENKQAALSWIYILEDKIQSCLCMDMKSQTSSALWTVMTDRWARWSLENGKKTWEKFADENPHLET